MLRSIGKQSGESNFVLEKKKGYGGKKMALELWNCHATAQYDKS